MAGLPEITIPPMTCCFGLEDTIEAYVGHMVLVWRELWRVLRGDGVGWLNLGDSYAGGNQTGGKGKETLGGGIDYQRQTMHNHQQQTGLPPKNLMGIPWRCAFALQADGWHLRSDVIWSKKNPMPESCRDRPTKSHEYVFLLAKSERYWWDQEAIREPHVRKWDESNGRGIYAGKNNPDQKQNDMPVMPHPQGRNKRTVWSHIDEIAEHNKLFAFTLARLASDHPELLGNILDEYGSTPDEKSDVWNLATKPYKAAHYKAAHFAVMPEALVEPCLLAGCPAQVCAECGEPWVRVVEKKCEGQRHWSPKDINPNRNDNTDSSRLHNQYYQYKTKTIAHTPTCQCCPLPAAKQATRPGVALDPFFGSGTVGAVAKKFKRTWLGIELNPDYIELARTRKRGQGQRRGGWLVWRLGGGNIGRLG
jgi:DNA modification methylase